ncbi:MAG: diphosphate--fructose-6-phosphate 1-phosphotransferase [Spirochaetaceae bacterium]|jgi:pyrophosphate--fructose-6-phosphate 1-phosphotransferase|nr:diphosphate--fructose-6-phosphate 1-phosphotransferase [Spirochaetaceae bacterium]
MELSVLQKARYAYKPRLPSVLTQDLASIAVKQGASTEADADQEVLQALFKHTYGQPIVTFEKGACGTLTTRPLKVGVLLSGGQAPGGHNVIAGLHDGLKKGNPESLLYGLCKGPAGLVENKALLLNASTIDEYRNTGGFDIIGSGRTKIEKPEQFAASLATARALGLDAIVIVGGDDSNTNAAFLAEYFLDKEVPIQVIGCPKTIDGDLKNEYIEASFGFDTACKTYSELIGNICRDANSAKKYWHFIKLMGRSASHVTLECALQTQPNICFISEEVREKHWSLSQVVDTICESVVKRADAGNNFGIVLIPEGLIEFVPEMKALIDRLNDALTPSLSQELSSIRDPKLRVDLLSGKISKEALQLLQSLPLDIASQLLMDRDPHGNVQVSRIETEKLLIDMVGKKLYQLKASGLYKGKFSGLGHFFGYEGRCSFPSNFDADYCYSLGMNAFMLIAAGLTSYLGVIRNLSAPSQEWIAGGVPLTMMMNIERRQGSSKPVIKKALVELDGEPFKALVAKRDEWALKTSYLFPGSIQYFGPPEVCDQSTKTLQLERAGASRFN